MDGTDQLRAELRRAALSLGAPASVDATVERPRDAAFGDWATNFAMVLARPLRQKPRDDRAASSSNDSTLRAPASPRRRSPGPGFINFHVAAEVFAEGLASAHRCGRRLRTIGRRTSATGQRRIRLGESHRSAARRTWTSGRDRRRDRVAARQRPVGASRASSTTTTPARRSPISRSASRRACAQLGGAAVSLPEGGYHGEYVRELAQRYIDEHSSDPGADDLDAIRRFAVRELRKEQDLDLQAFGVKFDVYFLESSLYSDGRVEDAIERLIAAGHTYEKDGALWLRTTDFGDDKDRVMRRSAEKGGEPTYFVPDVAYHVTKWERGFTRAINVQGADHHSTVTRVRVGSAGARHGHSRGLSGVRAAPDGDGDARR